MRNRISKRDKASEADAAQENWRITKLVDQKRQRCNVIILTDEEPGLVGFALTEKVECGNAESFRYQRVAVGTPQLGVLRQPVDQHVSRPALGTVQLVSYAVGAEGKERHEAPNEIGPFGCLVLAKNP